MSEINYKFAPACLTKSFSRIYDPVTAFFGAGERLQKIILGLADIQDEEKIIDIGCGTGRFLYLAKTRHPKAHFTGLDPDPEILKLSRAKFTQNDLNIEFITAYAEQVPVPDQSFDKIVSTLTLHHIPKLAKKTALQEIRRILKPEGQFFLSDFGKPKNLLWKLVLNIESLFEPRAYIKDNLNGEIPQLLREAGFTFKEVRPPYLGIRFYMAEKS